MSASVRSSDRFIAFLRAINVGGRVVKMERLKQVFGALGLNNVETFIASGNVIFEADPKDEGALELKIERALRKALGYEVTTFLRSAAELAQIANYKPFDTGDDSSDTRVFIGFLRAKPSRESAAKLAAAATAADDFHVHGRELYWRCRVKSSDSEFSGAKLEKLLGMPTTLRNVNTIQRLAAKYPARD